MGKKVALMCGHGKALDGSWDSGCSYAGYTEAALMLPIVKSAVKHLRANGVSVISDADKNNNRNIKSSVKWANKEKADIYISVHCDYYKAPSGVYPLYVSTKGKKLAKQLNTTIKKNVPIKSRGVKKRTDLYELNATDMPACILETGSIKADLKTLKNSEKYGKCIAKGVCAYLGVKFKSGSTAKTDVATKASAKTVQDNMCSWAKKIADGGKYKYKRWTSDPKTHQCPICHDLTGKYKGWNCIGFAFASWRHGGKVKSKCDCGVIANDTWEKLLKAKTDADAAKIAKKYIGVDVKVIRNSKKAIPTDKLKKGDIVGYFKGNSYFHTVLYVGNGKIAESNTTNPNISYGKKLSSGYAKVAIRYTGK